MAEWYCGLHTCFTAGWLYDFQTLITGILAVTAAIIAIGGQVGVHVWQESRRHSQSADAITFELIHFGGAISVALEGLVESRAIKDYGFMLTIGLPKIGILFEDAREMLKEIRKSVPGQNPKIMAVLTWRIAHFADMIADAKAYTTLMRAEIDTGEQMIKDNKPMKDLATNLQEISTSALPETLNGMKIKGIWNAVVNR